MIKISLRGALGWLKPNPDKTETTAEKVTPDKDFGNDIKDIVSGRVPRKQKPITICTDGCRFTLPPPSKELGAMYETKCVKCGNAQQHTNIETRKDWRWNSREKKK